MNGVVRFTAAALPNGKQGKMVPDSEGYYTQIIGGLNVFNSAGEYYELEGAKQLFESSGSLMRQIRRGACRAEVGHPNKLPGMSNEAFLQRIYTIDPKNVCAHFKEIWLDPEVGRQVGNPNTVAIMAKIAPSGPFGDMLREQYERAGENVCFSVRGITDDRYVNGVYTRLLRQIVTFDYVNEPGIAFAEKLKSPAIETFKEDFLIGQSMACEMIEPAAGIACEEAILGVKDLIGEMGWKAPAHEKPAYRHW